MARSARWGKLPRSSLRPRLRVPAAKSPPSIPAPCALRPKLPSDHDRLYFSILPRNPNNSNPFLPKWIASRGGFTEFVNAATLETPVASSALQSFRGWWLCLEWAIAHALRWLP
eukprot:5116938-Pyramimonas_sp.AAC.1